MNNLISFVNSFLSYLLVMAVIVVLAGIAIVFTILTILVFELRGRCIEKNKKMWYDWIEEKGLA